MHSAFGREMAAVILAALRLLDRASPGLLRIVHSVILPSS